MDLYPRDREDDLFEEAARIIVAHQQGSVSLLQRRLKVGYARAARLVDMLEEVGIGCVHGKQGREVLVPNLRSWRKAVGESPGFVRRRPEMSPGASPKILVLVDGTYLAYRAHFAFINRPLTTRKGEVTSAVYGFIIGLRKILQDLKPDRVAVVFDPPGTTFRHELYKDYKGTRERMPEDLSAQFPWIDRYLDAAGIPRLAIGGVEADDVLATLGMRARDQGMEARIVSNDKDLAQMVNGGIVVVTMSKPTEPPRLLRRKDVEEVYGVPPEKIVDLLSLIGDSSDNVPEHRSRSQDRGEALVGARHAGGNLRRGRVDESREAARGLDRRKRGVSFSRTLIRLKTDVELGIEPTSWRRERRKTIC